MASLFIKLALFVSGIIATSGETAPTIDWSSIINANSFTGLITGISTVLPIVVPVAITIASLPVVWKLTKRFMRG